MLIKLRTMRIIVKLRKDIGLTTGFWWYKMYIRWIFTGKLVKPEGCKIYGQDE